MFRDITIGQFYPTDSVLHRLDPRVKLLGVIVYSVGVFVINNILGFIFITGVLIAMISISNVPLKFIFRGMRFIAVIIIFAVVINLFFTEGNHNYWSWWIFTISDTGILKAVFFALRMVYVIVGASLLTYTTTPTTLTSGIEKALSPLNRIRFPAHEIALMMSIALRFIPILSEEVNKIINAQLARGADFDTGGIIKKAKGMIPILIPLFVSAFKRAADLATAMEARCYMGAEGRTQMNPLKYSSIDKAGYFVILGYAAAVAAIRVFLTVFGVWGSV